MCTLSHVCDHIKSKTANRLIGLSHNTHTHTHIVLFDYQKYKVLWLYYANYQQSAMLIDKRNFHSGFLSCILSLANTHTNTHTHTTKIRTTRQRFPSLSFFYSKLFTLLVEKIFPNNNSHTRL
jgi:hypothetical protein